MTPRRSVPILALVFSLALHAAAVAALLVDWKAEPLEEPALSIELVIVSAPLDAQADEPDPTPVPPPATSAPSPPAVEPAPEPPAPKAPEPPKIVAKPEVAKPAPPRPQPRPPVAQPPINLNPGIFGSDETQQARAPSGGEPSPPSFSLLHGPIPPYPAAARSRGQEGRVVLDVTIGIDGWPTDVSVGRSSGAALLDDSAVTTVKTWRFRNDSGRVLTVSVPIVFELRATAGR